jgi:mannose-1-phosphate guanylyltransferase
MKAFLLAAGDGTRLRPLTHSIPKCLVPIRGVPLLSIWLNWCRKYTIDEVLINTHAHAQAVYDYLVANDFGVRVTISHEPQLLGSAGTLLQNRAFIAGEPRFAILYADVLTNANFASMIAFHDQCQSPATIGVYHVTEPRHCGIVLTGDNGVVTDFVEKPQQPRSDLAFAGLMIASPAVLDQIPQKHPSDIGLDLLPRLLNHMYAFTISDYLVDIGTIEKYEATQSEWPGLFVEQETRCSRA